MFCFNSFKEKTKTNREESRVDVWLRVLMGKELIFVIFLIFEGVLFEVGNPHYICERDKTMSGGWWMVEGGNLDPGSDMVRQKLTQTEEAEEWILVGMDRCGIGMYKQGWPGPAR